MSAVQHEDSGPSTLAPGSQAPGRFLEGTRYDKVELVQHPRMRAMARIYGCTVQRRESYLSSGIMLLWALVKAERMMLERVPMFEVMQGKGLFVLLCAETHLIESISPLRSDVSATLYGCPYLLAQTPEAQPLHTPFFKDVQLGVLLQLTRNADGPAPRKPAPQEIWQTFLQETGCASLPRPLGADRMNPNAPPPSPAYLPPSPIVPGQKVDINPRAESAPPTQSATALAYQNRLAAQRSKVPVAGGPPPSIPLLTGPHVEGVPMAAQAEAARKALAGGFGAPTPGATPSIIAPNKAEAAPEEQPMKLHQLDKLPPEAQQDPEYVQGSGSLYASSQPKLALKYGIIRDGRHYTPAQVRGGGGVVGPDGKLKLSSGTQKDLQTFNELAAAQAAGKAPPSSEPAAEATDAEAATSEEARAERVKRAEKQLEQMGQLELAELMERSRQDILNNDEQKKIVEARITEPIDIADLIMRGEVLQRVPIIPGKFEPTFRSLAVQEDLALKRLIMSEAKVLQIADSYFTDKFAFMGVVAGLYAINGNVLPSHLDADNNFSDVLFRAKFEHLARYSFWMLQSLCVHFGWFDARVKMCFKAENIKNG